MLNQGAGAGIAGTIEGRPKYRKVDSGVTITYSYNMFSPIWRIWHANGVNVWYIADSDAQTPPTHGWDTKGGWGILKLEKPGRFPMPTVTML